MRHSLFAEEAASYSNAVLVKGTTFNQAELLKNYIMPLKQRGVAANDVIAFSLQYNAAGKAPSKFIKEYLGNLLPALDKLGVQRLYVADGNYFKALTSAARAEPHYGYVLPCKMKGFEHMSVVLGTNYQALIYKPELQDKLDLSIKTFSDAVTGSYIPIGTGIIHSACYPEGLDAIAKALESLHQYPELSCDIEAFSLRFNEAGIGTIAFAWDQHNGIAFPCDYRATPLTIVYNEGVFDKALHGFSSPNPEVRALLRNFFETYRGNLTWHNGGGYDIKVIIYTLWMKSLLDQTSLLEGLEVMTRDWDDTKIIAYLATNTTAGNVLGLKSLAHEFAGNWAKEEIKDIRKIPLDELLQYNLVDALSTNYVKAKYYPIMVADQQEELYLGLMKESQKMLLQVELTGMPLSRTKVAEVKAKLEAIQEKQLDVLDNSKLIKALNLLLQQSVMEKANAKLKIKQHPIEKFSAVTFNPNSDPQVRRLLYEFLGMPVLDFTDTKMPATGADTIKKLFNHATDPYHKEILEALIGFGEVDIILNTFIPAFERALEKGTDDIVWLHGSFVVGGTVSGRLSSKEPNLQNLPAGTTGSDEKQLYGKLIKSCFVAPDGWLLCGADFNSLEDMISALTTKDPNKLKVYTDGYDGHSLRAFNYFRDQCPDIVETVDSINSMKKKYPFLRQDSKAPTFLLTYGGTYHGMMHNLGWPEDKAKQIEKGYHELYKVSDDYVAARLKQASKDGYVDVAFGLRLRTPMLSQVVWGGPKVPYEAQAEGRTAGNAMGQSYGLLNNRAAVAFMKTVWASKYRHDIMVVALIHDAIYILIKDDVEIVEWANRELIKAMQWQELPELQHPTVKLGAALDIYWPSWATATTLPNDADRKTIFTLCDATKATLKEPA